jgi:hypothetical protein
MECPNIVKISVKQAFCSPLIALKVVLSYFPLKALGKTSNSSGEVVINVCVIT